jgi:hypothetical protein
MDFENKSQSFSDSTHPLSVLSSSCPLEAGCSAKAMKLIPYHKTLVLVNETMSGTLRSHKDPHLTPCPAQRLS